MTTSLWKRLRGEEHVRRLTSTPWRVVEAQHVISTRKLVDSDEELVELCSRLREVGRGSCAILFCEDEVLVESRPGRRLATSSGDVAR